MSRFTGVTLGELTDASNVFWNDLFQKTDLTEADIAMSYIFNPIGLLSSNHSVPKELILHYLVNSVNYELKPKIFKRPDVQEYLDEAITCYIGSWREIFKKVNGSNELARHNIILEIYENLAKEGVPLTWKHIYLLFDEGNPGACVGISKELLEIVAKSLNEEIPEELIEKIN